MARVSAFRQQVDIFKSQLTGPARQALMVDTAKAAFAEAQETNTRILGHAPPYVQVVDGHQGAALESVKPGGTIVFLFDVAGSSLKEAVQDAMALLKIMSPVGSGLRYGVHYRDSFRLLVNNVVRQVGDALDVGEIKPDDEIQITNLMPYARRIERGWSAQAPNGVFESAFGALEAKYGKILIMKFTYAVFPGFEVGRTKKGAHPETRTELRRAASYPTIMMRAK